jgi:hypothetical protein
MSIKIMYQQQIAVGDIEAIFNELLYSAVVDFLYEGDTESSGSAILDRGLKDNNYTSSSVFHSFY